MFSKGLSAANFVFHFVIKNRGWSQSTPTCLHSEAFALQPEHAYAPVLRHLLSFHFYGTYYNFWQQQT